MKTVFSQEITALSGEARSLEICVGDATDASSADRIDLLGLSCFRNDYAPTPRTIVRALWDRGIEVRALARNPARDHRDNWHSWISEPLDEDTPFGRLVCFEHESKIGDVHVEPSAVVGNIFRAVTDFVQETATGEFNTFRLPLLSTGNQGADKSAMLAALLQAAYTHLRGSLPVRCVQLVLHHQSHELHGLLVEAGRALEQVRLEWANSRLLKRPKFDYFLSYRRADKDSAEDIRRLLLARRPGLKFFLDEQTLQRGVCWKPEVVCGIHNSRRALCLITDTYADSRECIDEFHIALCLSRARPDFLRPLQLLKSRSIDSLPHTIRRVNLIPAHCPPRLSDDLLNEVLSEGGR